MTRQEDVLTEHQQTHTGTVLIRTVYTYDFDHRVIETIQGASSDTSTADYNSATGTDGRTWNLYIPDGNVTEQYQPNAFAGSGSVGSPDADYATAAAYNADDQRVAVYRPRYDTNAAHTPLLTNPVGTTGTQESQCPDRRNTPLRISVHHRGLHNFVRVRSERQCRSSELADAGEWW